MASIPRLGSPTSSRVLRGTLRIGSMSCCRGTGAGRRQSPRSPPEMHVNKVHRVMTIDRVAADLGEDAERLHELSLGLDTEDRVIWVYGTGDDQVIAFTDYGIETLVELIKEHRKQARSNTETLLPA